ncbi:hypothetical protein ACQCN2_04525 [Brevibacillus ginsengisoli]|uniref:hypothetical protein n=1 Tax=Brevibacillus ginsengisoli TaxID=363854 RepID=UPI003CF210E2
MYIRRKQLWWLFPIFVSLFVLGVALAKWTEQTLPLYAHSATDGEEGTLDANRIQVEKLINQLKADYPISYQVQTRGQLYRGVYHGEGFDLSGEVSGHTINMKRSNSKLSLVIDGHQENPEFLPYALFTPYEHAAVIQGQLHSIEPRILEGNPSNRKGFQFTLPADQVREMLALWLGPQFQADAVLDHYMESVVIRYELWYDTNDHQLKQLTVNLEASQSQLSKHDQLIFRFS